MNRTRERLPIDAESLVSGNDPELHVDSVERSIGIKIATLARLLRQRFDERVEAMGVTRAKYLLVATVGRFPGVTQRVIAQKLAVTDVTAGRLIDRVCADGLLERREHPDDRRAYCVYLTPAAGPLLEKLAAAARDYEREMFAGFDEAELDRLDMLLNKLGGNLGTRGGVGRPASTDGAIKQAVKAS